MQKLIEIGALGFAVDSRAVKKGELFFALKGERHDGHLFLQEVASKGAVAAVVEKGYQGSGYGMQLFHVDNVVGALQELAKLVQKERKSRVIAVTGSVGKTTTKEFIAHLLSKRYRVAKTSGNANSQAGLPLSILNGKGEEEILVAEMGMNHSGEIVRLMEIVRPEMGVITKIGRAHIGNFQDGLEGIVREKREVLRGVKVGVVHAEAMHYPAIQEMPCKKIPFSLKELPSWIELSFTESHLRENFMCAATVALEMGLSWEEIALQAKELKPFSLRFQKIEKNGILFINDCYNSNPEAVQAALENLPKPKRGGKTVAVLGEIGEQGRYSQQAHLEAAKIAEERVDHVLCFGKETLVMVDHLQKQGKIVEFFGDLGKLKSHLFDLVREGDVVLIKGKNTNKLWQILEPLG